MLYEHGYAPEVGCGETGSQYEVDFDLSVCYVSVVGPVDDLRMRLVHDCLTSRVKLEFINRTSDPGCDCTTYLACVISVWLAGGERFF